MSPHRLVAGTLALGAAGVLAAAALVVLLFVQRTAPVDLPAPTGPFAVGRAVYDWRDPAGIDPAAPEPGTRREILAWVWYPAAPDAAAPRAAYVPPAMRAAIGPDPFPFDLVYRDAASIRVHSLREPPVAPGRPFPVIVMRAGATGQVARYTTLVEDLASHGYVVVGIDAPYRTSVVAFPDGRVVRRTRENDIEGYPEAERVQVATRLLVAWDADIGFALDRLAGLNASDPSGRFTGRLDLARVGVFGHSFGGAQAAQFCHDDPRCRAGVDIDGRLFGSVVRDGMKTPFLFLFSRRRDGAAAADPDARAAFDEVQSVYDRQPSASRQWLFIHGASHFAYSDNGVILNGPLAGVLRLSRVFGLDPGRQLAVTAYAVRAFFDAHLGAPTAAPATLVSSGYPELEPAAP